jgi:aspartate ammonia-lyase
VRCGNLELNPFLPLVTACLLESIDLLTRADNILRRLCVDGITANEARCREHVESSTAVATALLPLLGYDKVCEAVSIARKERKTIRQVVTGLGWVAEKQFDEAISPEAVCRLGSEAQK